ncbi:zinc finger and BTB domain-containing protein 24-like [Ctenocephalides felis]|uniref:zinc finger and BTB domain-containing protein 24-like n=1 Tax=Ctenocephalides felis TaxID=7515 RepID=UPI000E6E32DF|nr:zinc finger and BTB domain-containing protein 24-like [Ctenocephalides felis]
MAEETIMSINDQAIKIEPPEYSPEDIKLEMEDEFDNPDVTVKSESCSEDDDTCLERFMNSEVTIEEEVKHELAESSTYECDICNRTFAESDDLKKHMADHIPSNSKECSFKCEVCYKAFNRLSNLKRHMLIHSGKRALECNICNKTFTKSSSLKTHMLIHSDNIKQPQFYIPQINISKSISVSNHESNLEAQVDISSEIRKPSYDDKQYFTETEKQREEHSITNTTKTIDGSFGTIIQFAKNIKDIGYSRQETLKRHILFANRNQFTEYDNLIKASIPKISLYSPHPDVLKSINLTTNFRVILEAPFRKNSDTDRNIVEYCLSFNTKDPDHFHIHKS